MKMPGDVSREKRTGGREQIGRSRGDRLVNCVRPFFLSLERSGPRRSTGVTILLRSRSKCKPEDHTQNIVGAVGNDLETRYAQQSDEIPFH